MIFAYAASREMPQREAERRRDTHRLMHVDVEAHDKEGKNRKGIYSRRSADLRLQDQEPFEEDFDH